MITELLTTVQFLLASSCFRKTHSFPHVVGYFFQAPSWIHIHAMRSLPCPQPV